MNSNIYFLLCLLSLCSLTPIEIADYAYPSPNDPNIYYVALLGVNDIHGTYFPSETTIPSTGEKYLTGGLDYLGKYISIMQNEWKDRFLWFDGGDEFQGGLETKLSEGVLITEFFNTMGLTAATFGNHEWDYGPEYLVQRLKNSTFDYLACNIKNTTSGETKFLPKQELYKIYTAGKVKIGVIGMANFVKKETSSGKFTDIDFIQYKEALLKIIKEVRSQSNAVIIVGHMALNCDDTPTKNTLQIFTKNTIQGQCRNTTEVAEFLYSLVPNVVDAIISGHSHDETHQWLNDYPVMSAINFGQTTNIMYLPFDPNTLTLLRDEIKIEAPLPVCEKVFSNIKRCPQGLTQAQIDAAGQLSQYTFHGVLIEKEEKLKSLSDHWYEIYDKFKKDTVMTISESMEISKNEETALGNLYTDILRKVTGADIAVINPAGFRIKWSSGNVTAADVYSMTPYENYISSFEMKGRDVRRMFFEIEGGAYAFYPTSGLKLDVKLTPKKKLVRVRLFDGEKESEIEDEKIYKIATVDFLYPNGGDDFAKVKKWFIKPERIYIGNLIKEDALSYLRHVDRIDVAKMIDKDNQRLRIIP